jgi:sigma-B regulation protein RsbU (phosphoserine phosphatase)
VQQATLQIDEWPALSAPAPVPREGGRSALIVDDSRAQRIILRSSLVRWGYQVDEAESGEEALLRCRRRAYDFVVSDWMMPGMSGLDFCRAFRALGQESYGYFVLLTSKSEKDEVARGLNAGADDFLAKPVNADELRARLQAGERILAMQREVTQKNRLLRSALQELRGLYDSLDRDLIEARKIQQSLVRERVRDFGSAAVALMLRPSGHVGGDLVGYAQLGPRQVAFFSIDVSGHGVASAMLAARLAGMLSGTGRDGAPARLLGNGPGADPWPPEVVAERLNRLLIDVVQVEQYLTCIYAVADLETGRVALVQAGHPHPLVLRADGRVERLGTGGFPVGLVTGATYERVEIRLQPGDRLFLMSDGLIECTDPLGRELGESGLLAIVDRNRDQGGEAFLDAVLAGVEAWCGGTDIGDDMSAVLFDYHGPAR